MYKEIVIAKVLSKLNKRFIYNGSKNLILKKVIKDDFNSIGTWFSSSPKYAELFGTLRKFELPSNLKFIDLDGRGAAFKFLWALGVHKEMFEEGWISLAKDYYLGAPEKKDNLSKEDVKAHNSLKRDYKKFTGKKPLHSEKKMMEMLVTWNKEYLTAYKKYLISKGFDGIYFPKRTPLDGEAHEAWVIFEPTKHDMKPIEE